MAPGAMPSGPPAPALRPRCQTQEGTDEGGPDAADLGSAEVAAEDEELTEPGDVDGDEVAVGGSVADEARAAPAVWTMLWTSISVTLELRRTWEPPVPSVVMLMRPNGDGARGCAGDFKDGAAVELDIEPGDGGPERPVDGEQSDDAEGGGGGGAEARGGAGDADGDGAAGVVGEGDGLARR